jgi:heme-degrading monooxygenase HmoA
MSVTILSKRLFKIDQKENLIPLFKELRDLAKKQNGFISRGTLSSLTDPGEYIVISEWETVEDWRNWMDKKETREIQGKIDSLLGEKTFFDVYLPEKF